MFSESTLECLKKSGWFPGRSIDIDGYVAVLERAGFDVFPCVKTFLREFARIEISYLNRRSKGAREGFSVDPGESVYWSRRKEAMDFFSAQLKTRLCPLGELSDGFSTVMISRENRFYAIGEEYICFLGNDEKEAVEELCTVQKKQNIPIDETASRARAIAQAKRDGTWREEWRA